MNNDSEAVTFNHKTPDFEGFDSLMKRGHITAVAMLGYGVGFLYFGIKSYNEPEIVKTVVETTQSFGFFLASLAHLYLAAIWYNMAHKRFRDTSGGVRPQNYPLWRLLQQGVLSGMVDSQSSEYKEAIEGLKVEDKEWRERL